MADRSPNPEQRNRVDASESRESIRSRGDRRESPRSNHDHRSPRKRSPSPRRSHSRSPRRYSRSRSRSPPLRRGRSRSRSPPRRSRSRSLRSYTRSRSPPRRGRLSRSPSRDKVPYRGRGDRNNPERSRCLGVFGLSFMTTERDLSDRFGKYGRISDVQLIYDRQTSRSRGFGFVYYENEDDAAYAKERTNGIDFDGRCIRVDFSITKRPHTPTPGVYMGEPSRRRRSRSPHRRRSRSRSRSPRRRSPRRWSRSRSRSYDGRRRRRSYSR